MKRIALALVLLGIAGMLDELDLEFLGFDLAADPAVERYRERFPEDPTATALELWRRFELDTPSTFAAMYQFWVREP